MKSSSGSISGCLVALFWVKGFSGFLKSRLTEVGSRFIFGELCWNFLQQQVPPPLCKWFGMIHPSKNWVSCQGHKVVSCSSSATLKALDKWQWISGREFLWKTTPNARNSLGRCPSIIARFSRWFSRWKPLKGGWFGKLFRHLKHDVLGPQKVAIWEGNPVISGKV